MKAKEVLHYYPNAKCEVKRLNDETIYEVSYSFARNNFLNSSIEYIKPMLTPLSDMTEEELKEIEAFSDSEYKNLEEFLMHYTEAFTPAEFHYLLSHGFDLFNLIESGEAIKKEK